MQNKSYEFQILQVIKLNDNDHCSTFCDEMIVNICDEENYFLVVVFSDEITFYLSETINRQSVRIRGL